MRDVIEITLILPPAAGPAEGLLVFLQKGFRVITTIGVPVTDFIVEHCGVGPEYVAAAVSTVFLNGKPVDDPSTALIPDGGTLALSGAMPGLVGAAMRSGGSLGLLRRGITHRDSGDIPRAQGTITVKLFNRIMHDLGMSFLKRGILARRDELPEFFSCMSRNFWKKCSVRVNGAEYDISRLEKGMLPPGSDTVLLAVDDSGEKREERVER